MKNKVSNWNLFKKATAPSTAVTRPVSSIKTPAPGSKGIIGKKSKNEKNEIFVDIFEKLSVSTIHSYCRKFNSSSIDLYIVQVLFNQNGTIINSSIDGVIQMKSYLRGNPALRLVLNDDLSVGRGNTGPPGSVVLDDCAFHESVDTRDFDALKTLAIDPPDGEFLVMNYRINGDYQTPYRVYPFIDELNSYKLQFTLKIKATMPSDKVATQLTAKFALPKDTATCTFDIPKGVQGQTAEHKMMEN